MRTLTALSRNSTLVWDDFRGAGAVAVRSSRPLLVIQDNTLLFSYFLRVLCVWTLMHARNANEEVKVCQLLHPISQATLNVWKIWNAIRNSPFLHCSHFDVENFQKHSVKTSQVTS